MLLDTQKTRYDVDELDETTLTKVIDEFPNLPSPLIKNLNEYFSESRNVWYINQDNDLETNSFNGHDSLIFNVDCDELLMKNIKGLNISCHFESDISFNVVQVGVVDETSTYTSVDLPVNKVGDVDVSIDLSSVNTSDLVYLIGAKRFKVFVEISSDLSIGSIIISNNILSCSFTNMLQDEIDAVFNRIGGVGGNGESLIDIATSWSSPPSHSRVTSEKLVKDTIDNLEIDLDMDLMDNGYLKICGNITNGE